MENENSKASKIIITISVIIIFAIMCAGIALIIVYGNKTINQSNRNTQYIENEEEELETEEQNETMISNEIIIEDKSQTLNRRFGKVEILWLDNQNNIIKEPNKPILKEMTAQKYNESSSSFIDIDENSSEWYNYSTKLWANAKDDKGSYFVWIPRYAYKITYYSDNTYREKIGYCDYRGILKISDNNTLIRIKGNATGLQEVGNHYILAPAFMRDTASGYRNGGWDGNLSGIWVAKYEMSMEVSGKHMETSTSKIGNVMTDNNVRAVSKPSVSSWRNISIGNCYYNSYNYNREYESHLMKNSEWGAVAYLSHSIYGTNTYKITVNDTNNYITGGSKVESEVYNYRVNQSSNGNVTGVFDLAGGAGEFISGFINNGYQGLTIYGGIQQSFLYENSMNSKYKTIYSNISSDDGKGNYNSTFANGNYELNFGKRGDAIYETSATGFGTESWNTNSSFFMQQDTPFISRGGDFAGGTSTGIFSFNGNSGQASAGESYRVVLAME